MIKNTIAASAILLCLSSATAQMPPDPDYVREQIYPSYADFRADIDRISGIADATQRAAELNAFWQRLLGAGQVPYAQGNQVAFLYRGGGSVAWPGDFNRWNPDAAGWSGATVPGTDLIILEKTMPTDARLDYKLFRNGSWILDPANPLQMWSGFGPNSELRMPGYQFPQETVRRNDIAHGTLSNNVRVTSSHLGYDVQYRVHTPAGYETAPAMTDLPVVYVTDGHEYAPEHLGALVNVVDNLIADKRLRPMITVFIDPRDPDNLGNNRRASEYITNADFADFVAEELVPTIDAGYRTSAERGDRTILGTSLGGLNSAYFGAVETATFQNIAIQSPAFWADNAIFGMYNNADLAEELRLFITNGLINDSLGVDSMIPILNQHNYDYRFTTANEGHSWGNWRGQLDDMLVHLVGPPVPEPTGGTMLLAGLIALGARARRCGNTVFHGGGHRLVVPALAGVRAPKLPTPTPGQGVGRGRRLKPVLRTTCLDPLRCR